MALVSWRVFHNPIDDAWLSPNDVVFKPKLVSKIKAQQLNENDKNASDLHVVLSQPFGDREHRLTHLVHLFTADRAFGPGFAWTFQLQKSQPIVIV
jgi:hypothetical protein